VTAIVEVERARAVTYADRATVMQVAHEALTRRSSAWPQIFVLDLASELGGNLFAFFAPPEKVIAERRVGNIMVVALGFDDAYILLSTPWHDFPRNALNDVADSIARDPAVSLELMHLVTVAQGGILLQYLDLTVLARGLAA
jgi:hypothetical protein